MSMFFMSLACTRECAHAHKRQPGIERCGTRVCGYVCVSVAYLPLDGRNSGDGAVLENAAPSAAVRDAEQGEALARLGAAGFVAARTATVPDAEQRGARAPFHATGLRLRPDGGGLGDNADKRGEVPPPARPSIWRR